MSRAKYIGVRTVQTVFILWLVLSGLWVMFRLMPGDFTARMVNAGASPEAIAAVRERWGLNDPIYVQYWRYITNFVRLDVGESVVYGTDVWTFTKMKIFNTFILVAPGITFAYILGSAIGTVIGSSRGSLLEKWGLVPLIFSGSFPSFFTAILLILVFASTLNWFPTSGMLSPGIRGEHVTWWTPYLTRNFAAHYVLPFTAVILRYLFMPSLIMRTSVVETKDKDFMEYHRLTGLPVVKRWRHLARHSSLPVITVYPVSMSRALGGLVLVETVFNWPGIGFTLVEAVLARDYPVVQFVFFIVAAFVIIANFFVDIVYGIIDPRVSIDD